jgi:hypothetical protein
MIAAILAIAILVSVFRHGLGCWGNSAAANNRAYRNASLFTTNGIFRMSPP